MFDVNEATAGAIRRAYEDRGELTVIVEFKRHFPLIADHAKARECVRIIAGWKAGDRAHLQMPDPIPRPGPIPIEDPPPNDEPVEIPPPGEEPSDQPIPVKVA